MNAQAKLTDTQTAILKAAAYRPDGNIEPLPPTLRGGARAKVIEGLLTRQLMACQDGQYFLTDAGYAAVGRQPPSRMPARNLPPTPARNWTPSAPAPSRRRLSPCYNVLKARRARKLAQPQAGRRTRCVVFFPSV